MTEPTLREIDGLVEEIASLSKAPLAANEFYREFLRRVLSGLAASGGVVWAREASGRLRVVCRWGESEPLGDSASALSGRHERWATQVLEGRTGVAVPPRGSPSGDPDDGNPTDWLLLFSPWQTDGGEAAGVVEVFQRPGASPSLERGYLRFLEVAGELLADYQRNNQLRDLRRRAAQWAQWEDFAQCVHGSLELSATAYTAANEVRRILDCDRASVLVRRGSRCPIVAISGMERFDRRAPSVRLMERLAGAVVEMGEPLWHPESNAEHAPQVAEPLDAYLDECHARGLAIVPLRVAAAADAAPRSATVGALVLERFHAPVDEPLRESLAALCPHIALAIHNAREVERLPLGRLLRKLRAGGDFLGRGRRLGFAGLLAVAVAAVLVVLVAVPADFTVAARGELQPCATRDIFAPSDGVVRELRIAKAGPVAAEQVLLVLRKPELDLEFKRVWGERQTARTRLAAIEAEQLQNRRDDDSQRKRAGALTAQQEELRELIASLEAQYAILQQQQAELEVRSPMAGELLTWNAAELLEARPVVHGQVLLTVAELAGPWRLDLRIPDRRMLHVLRARRELSEPLPVAFIVATHPGQVLRGTLDRVGLRTETTETEGAVVLATVQIDRAEVPAVVPGAGVVARIHCGRRALGYVWLHDLIDAIQGWLFF